MSGGQRMCRDILETSVTISSGSKNSSVLPLGQYAWGSYSIPSAFTGATITVQYSNDGSNFTAVPEEGTESNPETVSANGTYRLPAMTCAAKYMRLVSASNEGADRTITVYLRS